MPTSVLITLIICGTIIMIAILGLLFAAWVIRRGMEISREEKKSD